MCRSTLSWFAEHLPLEVRWVGWNAVWHFSPIGYHCGEEFAQRPADAATASATASRATERYFGDVSLFIFDSNAVMGDVHSDVTVVLYLHMQGLLAVTHLVETPGLAYSAHKLAYLA